MPRSRGVINPAGVFRGVVLESVCVCMCWGGGGGLAQPRSTQEFYRPEIMQVTPGSGSANSWRGCGHVAEQEITSLASVRLLPLCFLPPAFPVHQSLFSLSLSPSFLPSSRLFISSLSSSHAPTLLFARRLSRPPLFSPSSFTNVTAVFLLCLVWEILFTWISKVSHVIVCHV